MRGKKNAANTKTRSKTRAASSAPIAATELLEVGGSNSNPATKPGTNGLCVRLRNIGSPDQLWEIALAGEILIGRDTACQVCIDEKSISRRQCKLYMDASGNPTAENLSGANITQLNGEPLSSPRKLSEGDKLTCGRVTLRVDAFYPSSSHHVGNINKMTEFVNI
jgi:hypothetical protein